MTNVRHTHDEVFVAFTRALRAAGVGVTSDRTHAFLSACTLVGADDQRNVYLAGRSTLCATPDDLDVYDRVFLEWFRGTALGTISRPSRVRSPEHASLTDGDGESGDGHGREDGPVVRAAASDEEVLRHRDVAAMTPGERQVLARMFAGLHVPPVRRSSPRRRASRRGVVDARRTLRDELRHGGEPARLRFRDRTVRARRVVYLIDVSGSMSPYADSLLRLAHRTTRAAPSHVETFTAGTRLTHVTRAMRLRDGMDALTAAGETVPDWSGGTRLGEALQVFVDRWGQRGMARQAVVVIASDGWERGDSSLLREQMQRLHRLAYKVIWVNPHRGKDGYQPVQSGMVAALPSVDAFVAGHTLNTYQEVLEVIGDA